jgi:molybdate transport system ATP-binding protein
MVPTHQRDLGYVFQEASLFDHMDVWANLAFGVKRAKKPGLAQALDDAIELLGIGHLRHRPVYSLSGGERQRVAIARALAMQPQILLLDEPLASLDFARRQEILPWLEQMHKELKIPVIYVTHSLHELRRLADHVVLLSNGRVQTEGTVPAVLSHPAFIDIFGSEIEALGV